MRLQVDQGRRQVSAASQQPPAPEPVKERLMGLQHLDVDLGIVSGDFLSSLSMQVQQMSCSMVVWCPEQLV